MLGGTEMFRTTNFRDASAPRVSGKWQREASCERAVSTSGFRVQVPGSGFQVPGFGFRVSDSGFRISGFRF